MGGNLFGIGFGELVFLVILALIIFGPKRIPEIARMIGRFLQQVRQATGGIENEVRQLMDGQGDPSAWLEGDPPSRTPHHSAPRPMPFPSVGPPPGPGGLGPAALSAPVSPQEPRQDAEAAPPGPSLPQEQDKPEQDPPPSTLLSG